MFVSGQFHTFSVLLTMVPKWYYVCMPPKIRELIRELTSAGFDNRGGKGSHRNFRHPKGVNITISGRTGDDAKHYQIRDVKRAIELVSDEKE
jgi:predicted RNA binding protein YcfA (HicA-like mRNA interferase family)